MWVDASFLDAFSTVLNRYQIGQCVPAISSRPAVIKEDEADGVLCIKQIRTISNVKLFPNEEEAPHFLLT